MSALFVRLDAEIQRICEELATVKRSDEQSQRIKSEAPGLYSEWTHKTSVAAGLMSFPTPHIRVDGVHEKTKS